MSSGRATYEPHARSEELLAAYQHHRQAEEAAGIAAFAVFVYGLALALLAQSPGFALFGPGLAFVVLAYTQCAIAPARARAWEELNR